MSDNNAKDSDDPYADSTLESRYFAAPKHIEGIADLIKALSEIAVLKQEQEEDE